jgi:NADPH:quinone reductase-like Zn-dependent oxidoreductase/short-subunit dehydrogenase/acyl carrier protein
MTQVGDVRAFDDTGRLVAEFEGVRLMLSTRRKPRRPPPPVGDWLFEHTWRPQPLEARADEAWPPAGSWLVLSDTTGVGDALVRRLREQGHHVTVALPGPDSETDVARLEALERKLDAAANGTPLVGVVHLWSLGDEDRAATLEDTLAHGCRSLLHLAQSLGRRRGSTSPRLWVATRGAQAVANAVSAAGVGQAASWGLARSLAAEHPELRCTCIDLDPADGVEALWAELAAGSAEDQVAWRDGRRYVARLAAPDPGALAESAPSELAIATRGILDDLHLQPAPRRAPGPGEIEVRVHAAGLNFRDVLNALGVYEGPPGPMGSECSGDVVALGEGVSGLELGQPVVVAAAGTFKTFVTVKAIQAIAKPPALSYEQAAAAPVAFLTAEYAFDQLARLRAGERVLIHAGAGGVGLAAIQVAQRAGATIFATAGSPAKRALLASLGVPHVMDSRSLAFADEIAALTAGQGVDVVLNSLAGEFIPKSLGALARGGRFLEIGKTGIWTPEQMAAERADVAYFPIYLGAVEETLLRSMFERLMQELSAGVLKALPVRRFEMHDAAAAFRFMAQAKHVGKLVLSTGSPRPAVLADATYLVTGGLGSLGRHVARWLVDSGARHLVLAGRSAPSEEAHAAIAALERAGAEVRVMAADVACETDVAALLEAIAASMPALRGVVHAAGVLDDGVVAQQSWERFERVLAPKARGAWNLHRLTRGLPLDFFVLFASAASLFRSPGQGNYAAANAFLDALAHHRRAAGLPAVSLDWGPWAAGGMAASLEARAQSRLTTLGLRFLTPDEGIAALDRALDQRAAQLAILALDRSLFFKDQAVPPLFHELVATAAAVAPGVPEPSARPELLARLDELPAGQRRAQLYAHVRDQVLGVLGLDRSAAPDRHQGLRDLGMDSLMSIELRNRLQRTLGAHLPATLAFDFPTLEALTEHLAQEVLHLESPGRVAADPVERNAARAELEKLSEQEAETLLLAELATNRQEISK